MICNLKGIEDYLSDITNQNKENVMGIARNLHPKQLEQR